jgi:hypothetical protein
VPVPPDSHLLKSERSLANPGDLLQGLNSSVGEIEGRRRTRSSARGVVSTPAPSPPKKEKRDPRTGGGRGRGRPKKSNENDEEHVVATNNKANNDKDDDSKMDVDEGADEKDEVKPAANDNKKDRYSCFRYYPRSLFSLRFCS